MVTVYINLRTSSSSVCLLASLPDPVGGYCSLVWFCWVFLVVVGFFQHSGRSEILLSYIEKIFFIFLYL